METRRAFIRKKSYRIIKRLQDNGFEFSMHRNGNEHCTMALKNGINDHYSPCTVKDAKYYGAIDFGKDDKAFFDYLLTNNKMKTPEQKAAEYCKKTNGICAECKKVKKCNIEEKIGSCKSKFPYYFAFLAGYESANEWISVEDELPKQITNTVENEENGNTLYFYEHYAVKGYFENKAKTESIWIGVYRPYSVGWYFQVIKPQKTLNFIITHWKPIN